jgi:hypothetical protein
VAKVPEQSVPGIHRVDVVKLPYAVSVLLSRDGAGWGSQIYGSVGLEWIDNNDMRTVQLRHFPTLSSWLHNVKNAYFPWEL